MKTGYVQKMPPPESRRTISRYRRGSQDWIPDPIETPAGFWAGHWPGLLACMFGALICAGYLGAFFTGAIYVGGAKSLSGALIGAAIAAGGLLASATLPFKWWLDHRSVRRYQLEGSGPMDVAAEIGKLAAQRGDEAVDLPEIMG